MGQVKFVAADETRFRAVLRSRVDAYFKENRLSKSGDWRMAAKSIFYIGSYVGAYVWMCTRPGGGGWLTGMLLCGLMTAGIGFNVGHDASHGGYSSRPWLNRLMAHSFTLIGAHAYTWNIIHNIIHHTYTNIPHADGDLHPVPLLRYCDSANQRRPMHRFQHVYAFALYCLASLVWVFSKDYAHMRKKVHCGYVKPTPPAVEWAFLLLTKLGHYTAFLIVPYLFWELPLWQVIAGFILMHVVAGLSLATVFAVGHLVDDVAVVEVGGDGVVRQDWAEHQIRTTANFATDSAFWFWTVGGLNFQVEHHLFPTICHVHYPKIAPIVQATAREFGIPYTNYPSLLAALGAHVRFLKRYGMQPAPI